MPVSYFKVPTLVLMAISAMFWPFWITIILFLLGSFFFERFYFGLAILLFMDVIYGFQGFMVGPFHGMLTVFGILAYTLIRVVKQKTFGFGR